MLLVVCFSEKGGVGKSALSHALCYAASMVEDPSKYAVVLGHTDDREPVIDETRLYKTWDLRDPQVAYETIHKVIRSKQEGLLVIDTGANRLKHSKIILAAADIILIPIVDDYDSVRMGRDAGSIHPEKTYYVINRSPAKHAKEYPDFKRDVLDELGSDITEESAFFFPQIRAIKQLIKPVPIDPKTRYRLRKPVSDLWHEVKDAIV